MEKKKYYLGLDMGTNSVGWAVTDENYRLLKVKGKDLWGIREFDEAKTSADRRSKRTNRRRHQREVVRIGLLKDYFHDAISEIDPLFYQRMENSKYHFEDKDNELESKNAVFNDKDYSDKEYYKAYPTIFHLRKELVHNGEPHDVRLVYLALLNMFKHRGHFLNQTISADGESIKMKAAYTEFVNILLSNTDVVFPADVEVDLIEKILGSREYSRSLKAEKIAEVLNVELKDKKKFAYIKAISGLKVNVENLFDELILDKDKKVDICFSDYGYEDKAAEISEAVGENYYQVIESMKLIYDSGSLSGIMNGYDYLSDARVNAYEEHKKDLAVLKRVIKKYCGKSAYDYMFRSGEKGTYSAYVNSFNSGEKQRRDFKERTGEALYKQIKSIIKNMPKDDEDVCYIAERIANEAFLPKQLSSANGIIPNQVHKKEMKKILSNAERYLPFLSEKDESGLTVSERILQLFSFQIPYYVGPVTEDSKRSGGNGWVIRKEAGQVLPWNIRDKIDFEKTSQEFIFRMVRRCTYISGERVLPKASLEYEAFCVLNEINNLRIDGERISVALKQDIYNRLFQKGKKITKKQLVNYLYAKGAIEEESQLSGIDININSSLSTYGRFLPIFGEKLNEDRYKKMVEDIVFLCTIHGEDKKFLKELLEKKYADELTNEQIKRIIGLKFKDWGNLSKEFLELNGYDKSIGESKSLIRMMWDSNENLMEILNNERYTYKDELEGRQSSTLKTLSEITPEDLNEYYFSAPVRRMVWQTILIIRELEEILGAPPKRLFVEMTRKPEEKKVRTVSRKQKFLDLYKKIEDERYDWKKEIEKADSNGTIRSKKMYLYLTQKGRCMYTGEPIDLQKLFDDNLYDIDHIYPRHFVKDNNIDNNLVLVDKRKNARKSDNYPLESTIVSSCKELWKELRVLGLITEEKYNRLTGRQSFSDEQKAGFIARQLVETSQGTKGVIDVLKQVLPVGETQIVYSKASNVSDFRHSRGLVKCRSVNDFHHAYDAYLNIVVGNVYFVKFTQNPLNFIRKEYNQDEQKNHYNLDRMFDWDVVRGNEVAWIAGKKDGEAGTISVVKGTLLKNTPLLTRLNFEGHGKLSDETLYSAKKAAGEGYIPLKGFDAKMQDVRKYGGFSSVSTAYFFLVEHEVKGKRVRTIEIVPIYLKEWIEKDEGNLLEYCINNLGLVNPSIRLKKIKIQSLIKKDGYWMYVTGKTNNSILVRNAVSLCLKQEWIAYIKKLEKFREQNVLSEVITKEKNIELFYVLKEKHLEGIFGRKPNPIGGKLQNSSEKFEKMSCEEQCALLSHILDATIIGGSEADLSLIGESKSSGKMKINKLISNASEFKLYNQSVTGIYEKVVDLLKV